jgi:predicted dehydrogenase
MKILILGYSNLCKRKIIPIFKRKLGKIKFCICSKSQKWEDIGASEWYRNYEDALEKSRADLVYISLPNSLHYYWAKRFLKNNYHVIIDKPATLNFTQAKDLVKEARRRKKLLSEAIVFNYHHQIDKSIKEISSLKNLNHVDARFIIPKLEKKNFRNSNKYGGGCLFDMGPYAAAAFRIFINENHRKVTFYKLLKENKKDLNISFKIYIIVGKKSFFGYFSHNGEYENSLSLFTKRKKITINRVFSPPNDINLTFQVNESNIRREKRLKKDDAFLNYFKQVIVLLRNKKFENSYQNLLKDSFFREKLIK